MRKLLILPIAALMMSGCAPKFVSGDRSLEAACQRMQGPMDSLIDAAIEDAGPKTKAAVRKVVVTARGACRER